MVLLDLISSNEALIAKFRSLTNETKLNIIDNKNNIYSISVNSNSFNIYNNNDKYGGINYSNDTINVNSISCANITNNTPLIFPNKNIPLSTYYFQSSDNYTGNNNYNVFDLNPTTFWKSDSVYNLDGTFNLAFSGYLSYNFNNLNIYGAWIQFILPYSVCINKLYISLSKITNDASTITLIGLNTLTNKWDYLLNNYTILNNNNFININNINLYSNITLIINKTAGGVFVIINDVAFYSSSLFYINNKIKISDNNIYDINTLKINEIILNGSSLKSFSDIPITVSSNALLAITSNLNTIWNTSDSTTGYTLNKIAINKSNATTTLDINGNINYNYRILQNYIIINTTLTNIYNNSYIKVGTFYFNSSEYFELNLYIYDYNPNITSTNYYSQSIKVYGIANINSKIYYDIKSDNTNSIVRITNVFYYYISNNAIEFYVKYNDDLDITNTNPYITTTLFSNIVYVDFLTTYYKNNVFVIPNNIQYPLIESYLLSAIKNTEKTSNITKIYNTLYADNINFTNLYFSSNNYTPNTILYSDVFGNIKTSSVSFNQLNDLSNISLNSNKVLLLNDIGKFDVSSVSKNQLNSLSNISLNPNNIVFINSNGLLDSTSGINIKLLQGLSNISLTNNRFVFTDNNGILTTSSFNINSNFNNLLSLYNFNNSNIFVLSNIIFNSCSFTSNISIANNIISWNSNLNKIQLNNNDFADDIFKKIMKYPYQYSYSLVINTTQIGNEYIYSFLNYTIKTNINDYNINYEVYNVFNSNLNIFWKSSTNFNTNGYIINRYINGDLTLQPCGSYITFTLPDNIILYHYIIYYDNNNYYNTINSFKLYGYNSNNNIWDLLDSQNNIIYWNSYNIFNINNKTKVYNTFSLCITKTNTITNNNFAIINYIEFYGVNNYSGNTNYIINNNPVIFGNNKIGISNYDPKALLSIGNDIYTSNDSILNLNNSCNINNYGLKILNLTRPSGNNSIGIRASHILNNWCNIANTRYDINLSHLNIYNENNVVSFLSDGRVGLNGITPDISLNNNYISIYSNIYIYNKNNKYISIGVSTISNNYSIILPNSKPNIYNILSVNNIDSNSNIYLNWIPPGNASSINLFSKIGSPNIITCNISSIALQVAGSCLIGSDNNSILNMDKSYYNNNTLIVTGNIYSTMDITTDSDINYKFNITKILNPLEKLKLISGYTFNRNDTNDLERRYCGLIAQEVQKVMPEAVITKHDGKLRLLYTNLSSLIIESIKEIDDKYENLDFKVNMIMMFMFYYYLFSILF